MVDNSEDSQQLCDGAFQRLPYGDVVQAVDKLKATMTEMQLMWDLETSKYEETIIIETGSGQR